MKKMYSFILLFLLLSGCGSGGSEDPFLSGDIEIIPSDSTINNPTTLNDMGDIDSPPGDGWMSSHVVDINDSGMAVGDSMSHVFYWDSNTPDAQMKQIGNHAAYGITYDQDPLNWGHAVEISPNGIVIGYSTTVSDEEDEKKRGFFYDLSTSSFYDITPFSPDESLYFSQPVDISNNDIIALTIEGNPDDPEDKKKHAIVYDVNLDQVYSGFQEDSGAKSSEAVGINDGSWLIYTSGGRGFWANPKENATGDLGKFGDTPLIPVAINNSVTPDVNGEPRPHIAGNAGDIGFFWEAGAAHPIGIQGQGKFEVVAMNDHDQVIVNNDGRAYLWELVNGKGVFRQIGNLGGNNTTVVAINNRGQVVGYSTTGESFTESGLSLPIHHAFVWDDGKIYDIGTHNYFYPYIIDPSFPLSSATAINDIGDVVGNSFTINGSSRAFARLASDQ